MHALRGLDTSGFLSLSPNAKLIVRKANVARIILSIQLLDSLVRAWGETLLSLLKVLPTVSMVSLVQAWGGNLRIVGMGSIGRGLASFGIRDRPPLLPWPGISPSLDSRVRA